jgi:hypothetical protein
MSRKNMGSRLADSLRQARQAGQAEHPGQSPVTRPTESQPGQATGKEQERQSKARAARSAPSESGSAVVRDEQVPAPNLDSPWDNLHPDRIWPD